MSSKDARNLDKLQARLAASRKAVQIARENLIEALGDHMCGSGDGPTPKALQALANASRREAKLLLDLAELATASALHGCVRQPRGTTETHGTETETRPQKR